MVVVTLDSDMGELFGPLEATSGLPAPLPQGAPLLRRGSAGWAGALENSGYWLAEL